MAISRAQILKELEPGLNAIFGTEYNRYENEHAVLFDEETSNRAFEEEALFRFGTGRTRGYGAEVEINVTAGRPSFRHVSLEAIGVGANARREVA